MHGDHLGECLCWNGPGLYKLKNCSRQVGGVRERASMGQQGD